MTKELEEAKARLSAVLRDHERNPQAGTLYLIAADLRTLLSALSRGDGWRPISEFVEKAYDDQILVGGADWDAPITIEAYQLRPESIAKWTGAPTHYHTGIPLPPVPEGEE